MSDLSENNGQEPFSTENVEERLRKEREASGPDINSVKNLPPLSDYEDKAEVERKRQAVLNLVNDVKSQREDIDKINSAMNAIVEKLQQFGTVIDAQTKAINTLGQGGTHSQGMGGLTELLQSPLGEKLMDKLLPSENNAPAPLIDQNMINEKMKQSFLDNLATGESITNFIKDSLKKNVTKKIINSSLAEIGKQGEEHGPA